MFKNGRWKFRRVSFPHSHDKQPNNLLKAVLEKEVMARAVGEPSVKPSQIVKEVFDSYLDSNKLYIGLQKVSKRDEIRESLEM